MCRSSVFEYLVSLRMRSFGIFRTIFVGIWTGLRVESLAVSSGSLSWSVSSIGLLLLPKLPRELELMHFWVFFGT